MKSKRKPRIISLLIAAGIIMTMFIAGPATLSGALGMTPFEKYGKLQLCMIDGAKLLCDENGNPVQLTGMNTYGLNWGNTYLDNNDAAFDALADDWKLDVMRLAMYVGENGYGFSGTANTGVPNTRAPEILARLEEYLQQATLRGIYVIVDWHVLSPGNPTNSRYLESGINSGILSQMPAEFQAIYAAHPTWNGPQVFFAYLASKYGDQGNVFWEPANEPNGIGTNAASWTGTLKPYFEGVISAIREYDEDGIVLVGTPNWSQYTDIAVTSNSRLADYNVMYTVHFYTGTHDTNSLWMGNMIDNAIANGEAVFVSEWGVSSSSGNGGPYIPGSPGFTDYTTRWLNFLKDRNISWAAWHLGRHTETSGSFPLTAGDPVLDAATGIYAWPESELTLTGRYYRGQIRAGKFRVVDFYVDGVSIGTVDVDYGATVAAPVASVKDGYDFLGWYKDAAYTEEWDFSNDLVLEDTTLYSKWKLANTAYVSITGPDSVVTGAGAEATYTISAAFMPVTSGIELEFEVDGAYLSSLDFNGLNGFSVVGNGNYGTNVFWTNNGDIWTGKVTLINLTGSPISGDKDLFEMIFSVKEGELGSTDVKLNYVKFSTGGGEVATVIENDTVTTVLEKWYSPYDLNKDGVIDLNDLTFAMQFLNVSIGDANWDEAMVCDFDISGDIGIGDLIIILAHYTVPYY